MSASAPAFNERNKENAQHSTGPRTEEGKARSSQNSLKHGLASGKLFIEGENQAEFDFIKLELRKEHRPAGITEDLLVEKMAVSFWLSRRAVLCQASCFDPASDCGPADLPGYIRYQTTSDRAFYKALETLRSLQRDRIRKEDAARAGFVLSASDDQLFDMHIAAYSQHHPDDVFPKLTADERLEMIGSYSQNTPEASARRREIIYAAGRRQESK